METISHRVLSATSFLPEELYCQIFSHLSTFEITHAVSLVCSLWARISKHELLWQTLACRHYPVCQTIKKKNWFQFYHSLTVYLQRGAIILHKRSHADYLYSASDRNLCIWRINLKSVKQQDLGSPIQHTSSIVSTDHLLPITALAIQAFKRRSFLLSGSMDATIKIWQGLTCQLTLQHHKTAVTALQAFMHTFVSGSEDGEIVVWQKRGADYHPVPALGHRSAITDLQFSNTPFEAKQDALYSASQDHTVRMWAMHFDGTLECLKVIHFDPGYDLNACTYYLQNLHAAVSNSTLEKWRESFEAFTELKRVDFRTKNICLLSTFDNNEQFNLWITSEDRLNIKSYHLKHNKHQFIFENEIQLKQPALKLFHSVELSFSEPIVYVYHQDQTISIYYQPFFCNSFEFLETLHS